MNTYDSGVVPSIHVILMVGAPTVLGFAFLIIWRRIFQLQGWRAHLWSCAVSAVLAELTVTMLSKAKIAITRFIAQLYTGFRGARAVSVSRASASLVRNSKPASGVPASEFSASCVVSSRKCFSDSSRALRAPAADVRKYTSKVMMPVTPAPAVPPRKLGQNDAHGSGSLVVDAAAPATVMNLITSRILSAARA